MEIYFKKIKDYFLDLQKAWKDSSIPICCCICCLLFSVSCVCDTFVTTEGQTVRPSYKMPLRFIRIPPGFPWCHFVWSRIPLRVRVMPLSPCLDAVTQTPLVFNYLDDFEVRWPDISIPSLSLALSGGLSYCHQTVGVDDPVSSHQWRILLSTTSMTDDVDLGYLGWGGCQPPLL